MLKKEKDSFKSFEELECWKACTEVRRFITTMVKKLPKEERFALIDDMKRAQGLRLIISRKALDGFIIRKIFNSVGKVEVPSMN